MLMTTVVFAIFVMGMPAAVPVRMIVKLPMGLMPVGMWCRARRVG